MSIARRSSEVGLQLAIHGIGGDKMVETILDIYSRLGNARCLGIELSMHPC